MATSIRASHHQQLYGGHGRQTAAMDLAGKHVHFVGIGGCGISGLAHMAQQRGAVCSGTDLAGGPTVDALRQAGLAISLDQSASSVPEDCELLVISAAIQRDHPEWVEARRRGLAVLKYAQLLGALMVGQTGIAIAGTHGKSTTTSLLGHVLIHCEQDPSLIVGANCPQIGGGFRVGASDLLLAEACEYDRSFHRLHPKHAVILNVEEDHLDMYSGLDEIVEAFNVFARRVPSDGTLLINHEMPHRLAITAGLKCTVETLGFAPQADWRVQVTDDGLPVGMTGNSPVGSGPRAQLFHNDRAVVQWSCPLPGEHMAYNAAAAAVTAHRLGAAWNRIRQAIEAFHGLDRRMQRLGVRNINGQAIAVVDDYGHHPTEIDTTLRALRRHYRPQRLVCVFQPHQHSRTRFLLEEFAVSFSEADIVIVPHIYFVRDSEKERHAVSAGDLVDRLRQKGVTAMHLYPFAAIVEQLEVIARDGDLLVTIGAGDVWKVAREFSTNGRV